MRHDPLAKRPVVVARRRWRVSPITRLLCRFGAVFLVGACLAGLSTVAPVLGSVKKAAAQPVDTGLTVEPVFSRTLIGDFTQGGNTLLQCAGPAPSAANSNDQTGAPPPVTSFSAAPTADFTPIPNDGCGRDVSAALALTYRNQGIPYYNDQVTTKYVDQDTNAQTDASSSVTVTVPPGATVDYAELEWAGSTYGGGQNPSLVTSNATTIWQGPMEVSIGDDQHYVSVSPDQGTTSTPGNPAANGGAYYYAASADITADFLASGHLTGPITVWGADAPFYTNGFNRAGLGWHVVVVYEYPSIDTTTTPPHVFKQITLQTGMIYQAPSSEASAATNTVIDVPPISDANNVTVGVMGLEGDVGIGGDVFRVNNVNIVHPFTQQPNNFWVSYAQNATNPNWTSNFSIDDVSFLLPSGIAQNGQTSMTLTTQSVPQSGDFAGSDTFALTGMNTAVQVLAPHFTQSKSVNQAAFVVGQPITYNVTVSNGGTGPGTATLADTVPPTVAVSDVTCAPAASSTPGATCTAGHTGNAISGTIDAPAGGSVVFTITGTVTATGSATNTATIVPTTTGCGTETDCGGGPASTPDTPVLTSSLALIKAADPTAVSTAGQPVSYTFTVRNSGEATIDGLGVGDVPQAPAGPASTVTCDATTLAAGESTLCHSTYDASAADIAHGNIFDTATASGTATAVVGGPPVPVTSNPFSASVDVQPPQPGFTSIVVNTDNTLSLSP